VRGEEIQLFGDGSQRRDFDYVDDVVDAFLRAGAMEAADGQVFNLGGEAPVSLLDLVKMLIELSGHGSYRLVPFPADRKRIDIGDFYADSSKVRRALGWAPRTTLRAGLARTIEYYRKHGDHYL
jgi:UDP-glucose 4-epimerase